MPSRSDLVNRFAGRAAPSGAPLLLDLTLWCKWHSERGTLPAGWGPTTLDAARALGTPAWAPFKPWRVDYDGVEVTSEETDEYRNVLYRAAGRTLRARWTRGPDGDWWQTEYPVKTPEDLEAAVEIAGARRYRTDAAGLVSWRAAVGEDGVVPLELPMQPYSDLLHVFVGWSDGLSLIMGEGKPVAARIVAILQEAQARLVEVLAGLEADLLLAPDNLDGQYISPRAFKESLTTSYTALAEAGRRCGKPVVVHIGGPARKLVPLIARAGIDGIEGIAGAPQGDADLAEARSAAGQAITLWGGIPQDWLSVEHPAESFEAAARAAIEQARADPAGRSIIGVADRVPAAAEVERLYRLVEMVGAS